MEQNQTQLLDNSYSIDMEEKEEKTFSREFNYKTKINLTLAEKIKVIQMSEMISNAQYLAQKFGCGRTQIQNILRNRQEYLDEWKNYGNPYGVRRKRSMALLTLGTIVHEWIQRCRRNGIAITDVDIRQTGLSVANIIEMREFRPHKKWLDRLKCKYKLSNLDLQQLNPSIGGSDKTKESIKVEDIIAHFRERKCENISVYEFLEEKLSSSFFKQPTSPESEDDVPLQLNAERSCHPATYGNKTKKTSTFIINKITSYKEGLNHLGPLEHFALMEEDIRAVGLINQLENLFRENMQLKEGESNCDKKK